MRVPSLVVSLLLLVSGIGFGQGQPVPKPLPPKQKGAEKHSEAEPKASANLGLAQTYERMKRWQDAEKFFQEAAKEDDTETRKAALRGIERVRSAAESTSMELEGGEYYRAANVREKAEDLFAGALKSESESVRSRAQLALQDLRSKLWFQRQFETALQFVKYLAAFISVVSFLLLFRSIYKIRQSIEFGGFVEVGEKAQGKVPYWLSYVRARIRSLGVAPPPAISPSIPTPPLLYLALPHFRDEIDEIDKDFEFAGTKIPFASVLGPYVKPKVRVVGGWRAPLTSEPGSAFAIVSRRSGFGAVSTSGFVDRPIQDDASINRDLEAFVYEVYLKAVESHAR